MLQPNYLTSSMLPGVKTCYVSMHSLENIWVKNRLGQKCTGSKMCWVKNVPGQKCVGSKMCRVKNVRVKNVWVKNVRVKNDLIPARPACQFDKLTYLLDLNNLFLYRKTRCTQQSLIIKKIVHSMSSYAYKGLAIYFLFKYNIQIANNQNKISPIFLLIRQCCSCCFVFHI